MTARFRTHRNEFFIGLAIGLEHRFADLGLGWFSLEVTW